MSNEMKLEFDAVSENEGFARVAVAAFVTPLDPTLQEVTDVKTAVSEAVTNAIIHGSADWGSLGQGPGKVVDVYKRQGRFRSDNHATVLRLQSTPPKDRRAYNAPYRSSCMAMAGRGKDGDG